VLVRDIKYIDVKINKVVTMEWTLRRYTMKSPQTWQSTQHLHIDEIWEKNRVEVIDIEGRRCHKSTMTSVRRMLEARGN
jgi:hypothetical protein